MSERRRNPFLDPEVAQSYQAWYAAAGRRALRLERWLLGRLLERFPDARTVLEVGCGTGEFTRWLEGRGLEAMGVDTPSAMLAEAVALGTPRCVQGDAAALPVGDGAVDLAALITTLEFVADPAAALAEAGRVAEQGLLLGVINRSSLVGGRYRRRGGLWDTAHLFTPGELTRLVRRVLGSESVTWRTTLWPLWPSALPLPWGGFIGMAVRWHPERETNEARQ